VIASFDFSNAPVRDEVKDVASTGTIHHRDLSLLPTSCMTRGTGATQASVAPPTNAAATCCTIHWYTGALSLYSLLSWQGS
jgi:hypothetical protein